MVGITMIGRVARDTPAALAFATEITGYVNEKYRTNSQCWLRMGGPSGQVVWQTTFENMAAMEKLNESLMSDQQYWAMIKEAEDKGLFDTSSFEEGVWTKIS